MLIPDGEWVINDGVTLSLSAFLLLMPACRNLEPSRSQAYDLTDTKLPCSDNCPINAGVVFVHADHGLH